MNKILKSILGMEYRKNHHELWSESGQKVRVSAAPAWTEHPRPQMKRDTWYSLNGMWQLDEQSVRVPFPPQSALSGYEGDVGNKLHYVHEFILPAGFDTGRILLHFGAVDQVAEVRLNGSMLGRHEGGYLPFTFDVTDCVRRQGLNRLTVDVTDTLSHKYPYGKQRRRRGGMWYTPVSGIWQSVWLESVPVEYIKSLVITPDLHGVDLTVEGVRGFCVTLEGKEYRFEGTRGRLEVEDPVCWTPEHPRLYPITVTAGKDRVESYFALRTVTIEKRRGVERVCLNGRPIFLHGVLDQGYFCDGIYLPACEQEYEKDILRMKELGFNLLRKHIKVEPEAFYYACDRLGMLVMQDMVNSGPYRYIRQTVLPTLGFQRKQDDGGRENARQAFFIRHMEETAAHLYNHPSVIAYTIFNEGWGQFRSDELYRRLKAQDPTRLVDSTSGWFAQQENDFDSRHIYFKVIPLSPGPRPLFVTECGGYSLAVAGHLYSKQRQYGYGTCEDSRELTRKIEQMYRGMILPFIKDGVCGCIYTQLSDVEDEINGVYTYDRSVCKVEREVMVSLAAEIKSVLENEGTVESGQKK